MEQRGACLLGFPPVICSERTSELEVFRTDREIKLEVLSVMVMLRVGYQSYVYKVSYRSQVRHSNLLRSLSSGDVFLCV